MTKAKVCRCQNLRRFCPLRWGHLKGAITMKDVSGWSERISVISPMHTLCIRIQIRAHAVISLMHTYCIISAACVWYVAVYCHFTHAHVLHQQKCTNSYVCKCKFLLNSTNVLSINRLTPCNPRFIFNFVMLF